MTFNSHDEINYHVNDQRLQGGAAVLAAWRGRCVAAPGGDSGGHSAAGALRYAIIQIIKKYSNNHDINFITFFPNSHHAAIIWRINKTCAAISCARNYLAANIYECFGLT